MSHYDSERDIDYSSDMEGEHGFYRLVVDFEDREGQDPSYTGCPLEADDMEDAVDEALDWLGLDRNDTFLWLYEESDEITHFALSTDPVPEGETDWPEDAKVVGSVRFSDV
jgi:hypothetical protein